MGVIKAIYNSHHTLLFINDFVNETQLIKTVRVSILVLFRRRR